MSIVYEEKPNIVKVTVEDEKGLEIRHIVGFNIEQVMSNLSSSFDKFAIPDSTPVKVKRQYHRRTKAEMEAARAEKSAKKEEKA